eukprot:986851-Amorphochlora_amoeboformis.AAC.3
MSDPAWLASGTQLRYIHSFDPHVLACRRDQRSVPRSTNRQYLQPAILHPIEGEKSGRSVAYIVLSGIVNSILAGVGLCKG